VDLSITAVDWLEPEGVRLRRLQQDELRARYGEDVDPGARSSGADVAVFLLGRDRLTGSGVICGGLRPLAEGVAEIKRLFVAPGYRGRGLSRLLLAELERQALALGWPVLRLETGRHHPSQIALCTAAGYRPIEPFGAYVGAPDSLCFEKDLRSGVR